MSGRTLNVAQLKENQEYVGGRNVVHEALKAGRGIEKLFIEKGIAYSNDSRINDIITIAKAKSISIISVERETLQEVERTIGIKSEGIVAVADMREDMDIDDILALCKRKNKEPFFIIINNILYEENLGAVLRTCAAGGVDALIIPKRDKRDITPTVVRISMGGSEYVPLIKANLFECLDKLRKEAIKIVGVELNGTSDYFDQDLKGPIALVLGGEDAGLTKPLEDRCDVVVKIPMMPTVQSLNVSVSTGIIIYEKIRQECQI